MTNSLSKAGSGRPAGRETDAVRSQLLEAARQLFARNEFKAVTIKRIADAAGVNGAMVHYYFKDKKGLYLAMIDQVFEPLAASLAQLEHRHLQTIEEFIALYTQILAENPWWPNFVVREVLFGEEGFRNAVLEKIGRTLAPRVLAMISDEVADGHFRNDLKPEYALLSLLGMTVFPFLSRTLASEALGVAIDIDHAAELAEHTSRLFLYGAKSQT